jgi:hypothetical protein
MTDEEKKQLVVAVITQLKSEGTDVSNADIVSNANGIDYVVAYGKKGQIVRAVPTAISSEKVGASLYMNAYTEAGVYNINTMGGKDLPIDNQGAISARLTVLVTESDGNNVITQVLNLNNNVGGEGNIYIRSCQNGEWKAWGKLQTNIDVGQVNTLDNLTDNGIYSGVWLFGSYNSYHLTFVCVVINDYFIGTAPRRISQFVYGLSKFDGSVVYQSRVWDDSKDKWGNWEILNQREISSMIKSSVYNAIKGVIADAPETFDTLKEIADWVDTHEDLYTILKSIAEQNSSKLSEVELLAVDGSNIFISHKDNSVEIDYKTINGGGGFVAIPAATTEKAGVMSAQDKVDLNASIHHCVVENLEDGVDLSFDKNDGDSITVSIPAVTPEKAGVMSAEDKSNLNSLGTNEYDALSVDRRTDGKAYYLSGLKVGDSYNGSVIDRSSLSITPIITLEKGQKVSYKSYAENFNAIIITDANNKVIFLSGAYTIAEGEYTATDTCYIYCTAYTNQISSDSYHCTVSASGMKATVERLDSHVNILQSKTESFMQGYRELFVNGVFFADFEQGSWIGFGEVGDNYTEKTDSSSTVRHYKVQVNQGTKFKYRLYAEGKYNVVITDLNGTILRKVGDSSNWKNYKGEYIATEECVIYINQSAYHATMEHSDYYAILVDKDIRPRIDIKASDSEIEIWHKLKKAISAGGYNVYFEPATYTFKEIYDVWKALNWQDYELPIGGGCNYYCNGSTFISVDPESGHVGSRATFGVGRSVQSFCIQDANIINIGGTYCFHDEGQNKPGKYIHRYDNCKMQYISNEHTTYLAKCIGGGTGLDGEVIINNCTFVNDNTIVTNGRKADPISWHGNLLTSDPTKFSIEVRNCHFTGGFIAIGANERGQGDDFTVLLTGNSADKECLIVNTNKNTDGWKEGSLIEKIWDNELRGAPNLALRALFVAAGAEYNDTDQIIQKTAPWGETVQHLPKHYYLNGLGDITEEQMIDIYNAGKIESLNMAGRYHKTNIRTNLPTPIAISGTEGFGLYNLSAVCNNAKQLQVILLNNGSILHISNAFYGAFGSCYNLEYVYPVINVSSCGNLDAFYACDKLKHIELKGIKANLNFSYSSNIFKSSILYIIQNAAPTSAKTITLHADAYARLNPDLEENADIKSALEAQPLITLASA